METVCVILGLAVVSAVGLALHSAIERGRLLEGIHDERKAFAAAAKAWNEERQAALAGFAQERLAWTQERRELNTRIQAWEAPRGDAAPDAESQGKEQQEGTVGGYSAEHLRTLGLKMNPDGDGFIHADSSSLWESVADYQEYIRWLKREGLPLNTHPDEVKHLF